MYQNITKKVLQDMREWVEDCSVNEYDLQDIIEATDCEIIDYVLKRYRGGIEQFIIDSI